MSAFQPILVTSLTSRNICKSRFIRSIQRCSHFEKVWKSSTYLARSALLQARCFSCTHPKNFNKDYLVVSEEVQEAVQSRKAVVALESTIITHGMPYPHNFSTALCVERRVRENGAVPATVAVMDGKICVGLSDTDLIWLAEKNNCLTKISRRDLAWVLSRGGSGGTTVSATMIAAHMSGIPIFATGGIGGVHRGAETSFDISADLIELGQTPVTVVSSGVKSILDIPKTLEYLETQGVFVASFSDSRQFPAFFTQDSGHLAPYNVTDFLQAAQVIDFQQKLQLQSGMLLAVPIPSHMSPVGETIEAAITEALDMAEKKNISGKEVTPFVLGMVNQLTAGESLVANIALVENNASVAGGVANCLAQLRAGVPPEKVVQPSLTSHVSATQKESDTAEDKSVSPRSHKDIDQSHNSRQQVNNKQAKGRPVVVGATVVDLSVRLNDPHFQMNGVTYPGKMLRSMGGVGRNLADCLSRLGCKPLFVSATGPGDSLDGCGHMDLSLVQQLSDHSTATYCPVLQSDGQLLFGVGDMDINVAFDIDQVEGLDTVLKIAPLVMIDGNFSHTTICSLIKKSSSVGVPVWFEPTDPLKARKPFLTDAWKHLSVASPNIRELCTMHSGLMEAVGSTSTIDIDDLADLNTVLDSCVAMCRDIVPHIPVIVVTLGHHGVLLCHSLGAEAVHDLLQHLPVSSSVHDASFHAVFYPTLLEVPTITSVSGAGDCLAATLVACMLDGQPIDQCVKYALLSAELSLAAAAAVPESISSQTVLDSDVLNTFQHWKPRILHN